MFKINISQKLLYINICLLPGWRDYYSPRVEEGESRYQDDLTWPLCTEPFPPPTNVGQSVGRQGNTKIHVYLLIELHLYCIYMNVCI